MRQVSKNRNRAKRQRSIVWASDNIKEKKAKKNSNGKETIGPKAPKTKKEPKTKKAPKTKKGKNGPTEIGQGSQAPLAIVMLLTISIMYAI
ncbi:hypothetical protein P8452_56707 [Trifolium repens]|nr:hypothetical protein P8452_56707 [Trifolium repens]